ncbi:MAG: hypothetical protein KDD48_08640 [Bdellovibrionales bacterium]|nr:hypothetical protein [Bdellovibrionales bacterium]
MRYTKLVVFSLIGFIGLLSAQSYAGPGDYSLRVKAGPSFSLNNSWSDQLRIGADFDYDLGYSMGVGFLTVFGFSDDFRFQMIPTFRYDVLYIGPGSFHALAGVGYGRFNGANAMDVRTGLGLTLPLGDNYEVNSDVNLFFTPAGTSGTPVTLDWLIAFGFKFH